MIIDIREDIPELLDYVCRRVNEHIARAAAESLPPVKIIHFGFEFGQSNWVALVFDTRPNAEPDGDWTLHFNNVLLQRPKWPIWHKLAKGERVEFINLSGNKVDVMENPDDLICGIVGEAMKHVLLIAREQGIFQQLPKADRCELCVENFDGYFGWPHYENRGQDNLA